MVARLKTLAVMFVLGMLVLPLAAGAAEVEKTSSDQGVIDYINQLIRQGWEDAGYKPSAPASDGEWCRRVYLDIVGRIPTVEELSAFRGDKDENKKAKLVDKLLESQKYEEEYAQNWTTIWTNVLIGRRGGNDPERPVNRLALQQYVRRQMLRRTPYDKIVYDLIAADGSNTPGEAKYNGATNFVLDNLQEMQVPLTNKVSQIFMGRRVGCTQCHNHPFNDWKQNAFWEMNAFFKQATMLRTFAEGSRDIESAVLTDGDFEGEDGNYEEAAIYYELRNGLMKVAYPTFIDGTEIKRSGLVEDVNRRDELAKLVQKSPFMAEAAVNRIWGHFLGYGFTKPIDDMGPHNPPSHPELLERLSNDFGAYGYDLRRLMRWITLSEAYSLSSKITNMNKDDDPGKGETPLFTHFYIRQMNAEQLYESLLVATQADKAAGGSYEERERTKNQWLQQFVVAFGTDENDEATTFNGSIPQTLMLMNGELTKRALSLEGKSFLNQVAKGGDRDTAKIAYLYQAALSRDPSSNESGMAQKLWQARGGNTAQALQDVWWALINANEFIIIH